MTDNYDLIVDALRIHGTQGEIEQILKKDFFVEDFASHDVNAKRYYDCLIRAIANNKVFKKRVSTEKIMILGNPMAKVKYSVGFQIDTWMKKSRFHSYITVIYDLYKNRPYMFDFEVLSYGIHR